MKRTALRRTTGLSRSTALRPRARKMTRAYVDRRAFVAAFLRGRTCEMATVSGCFGPLTVHESLRRSLGQLSGPILPGEQAERVGQTFHALCTKHHDYVTDHPAWSRENGFRQ